MIRRERRLAVPSARTAASTETPRNAVSYRGKAIGSSRRAVGRRCESRLERAGQVWEAAIAAISGIGIRSAQQQRALIDAAIAGFGLFCSTRKSYREMYLAPAVRPFSEALALNRQLGIARRSFVLLAPTKRPLIAPCTRPSSPFFLGVASTKSPLHH